MGSKFEKQCDLHILSCHFRGLKRQPQTSGISILYETWSISSLPIRCEYCRCEQLTEGGDRRGIKVYIEYQNVCPFAGIGSPQPLPPIECVSHHLDPWGESHSLAVGKGGGDPIPTKGQKLWHSMYTYYSFYGSEERGGRRGHAYSSKGLGGNK